MERGFFQQADASRLSHVWLMLTLPAVLLAAIIAAYITLFPVEPSAPGFEGDLRKVLPLFIAINHVIAFGVLLWLLKRRNEPISAIGWNWSTISLSWKRELLVGLAGALALYLFKEFAIDSIRAILAGTRPTFTTLFNFTTEGLYVPLLLVATLLIFVEESIYRGFAIPRLGKRFGLPMAVLVSTLFFALLHWGNGPFALLSSFLLGLLMATIFLWRQNLVAVTVAHAGVNLLMLLT